MGDNIRREETGVLNESPGGSNESSADWLASGGEMTQRIRAVDWSRTGIGPLSGWPGSLRTVVNLVVESKAPMVVLWGTELVALYNDACRGFLAERHSDALGLRARDVWPEAWHLIEPCVYAVMSRGEAVFRENVCFPLQRHGRVEDAYFTLASTPLRVEDGAVGGVLITLQETTTAVKHLRDLEQTRAALHAGGQMYAAVFDKAPFAMTLAKMGEGTVVAVNDCFLRLFEYSLDEVIGKTCVEFGGCGVEMQGQAQADLYVRGTLRDWECSLKSKSGATRLVSLNADCVTIGGESYALTTIQDISARKEAEEAKRLYAQAQLAEAKFRGIIAISADAIVTINMEHVIVEWNQGAEKMFGYSRAEAIGMPLDVLIPHRHRLTHFEHVTRFATDPRIARRMAHAGASGMRKNGEEFPIAAAISRIEVAGELLMTAAIRDISEEKRIEEELRIRAEFGTALASLDYEKTLQELVQVAVRSLADFALLVILEADGRMRPVAGATRDPDKSWCASVLLDAPFDWQTEHPVWRVLATRTPMLQEVTPEMHDENAPTPEHLWVLRALQPRCISSVPLVVSEHYFGSLMLASGARLYDARDLQLMEEVCRQCALFIENARLHRAERLATQARDDVLGVVAHDLRNPLGVIMVETAMLAGRTSDDRTKRIANAIDRSARRMHRIIQDLLDVARFEAGRMSFNYESVSPNQLVADAVDMQGPVASAASLEIRDDAAPNLPAIRADRDRLLQVFDNLIGNAIKFSGRGGCIVIGAAQCDDEVRFWIEDDGIGIAAEDIPNVFDRFWRADGQANRGAGLGLAIVKEIVEGHGGRVWVESELGAGSTFYFALRVAHTGSEM